MWPRIDRIPRRTLLALLLALLLAPPLAAAPFGVPDEDAEAILAELADRFEVITTSRGYVLQERDDELPIIEVEERRIVVGGEALEPEALGERLGTGLAQRLLALSGDAEAGEALAAAARQAEEEIAELKRQLAELEKEKERAARQEREEQRAQRQEERRLRRSGTRFRFGTDLRIDEDERVRDVIVLFGRLDLRGEVDHDVFVIGPASVRGKVDGNTVVVGGSLSVGEEAEIDGDVTTVGGTIDDPADRIRGFSQEISFGPLNFGRHWWDLGRWDWDHDFFDEPPWLDLVMLSIRAGVLLFLILLVVAISRPRVERVAQRVRLEPWKAGIIGVLIELLSLPIVFIVTVVLVISLIGIPVAIVFLVLSILAAIVYFCLGYAGVAVALGNAATRRPTVAQLSPYVAVFVGLLLIQIWQIFGESLTLIGGFIGFTAYLLVIVGFLFKYVAWTVGLGGVFLERFAPLEPAYPVPPPPLPALPDLDSADPEEEDEIYRTAAGDEEDGRD